MEKKRKNSFLKIVGLIGGLFVLVFGNLKNFWRTVRLAVKREN